MKEGRAEGKEEGLDESANSFWRGSGAAKEKNISSNSHLPLQLAGSRLSPGFGVKLLNVDCKRLKTGEPPFSDPV